MQHIKPKNCETYFELVGKGANLDWAHFLSISDDDDDDE